MFYLFLFVSTEYLLDEFIRCQNNFFTWYNQSPSAFKHLIIILYHAVRYREVNRTKRYGFQIKSTLVVLNFFSLINFIFISQIKFTKK